MTVTPLLIFLTVSALQSGSAPASPSIADPVNATPANKKLCRSTKLVGSQIPKRVCHTAAEWHAIDNADEVNRSRIMEGRRLSGQ